MFTTQCHFFVIFLVLIGSSSIFSMILLPYKLQPVKRYESCRGALFRPLTKQAITLSIFQLSYPYFGKSFLHLFNMIQAIKALIVVFVCVVFVCRLKREISPKCQFCQNLYKSYFKSSVYYSTDRDTKICLEKPRHGSSTM